jgi:hypothetical protein
MDTINHVKPTAEELQANIDKAVVELDKEEELTVDTKKEEETVETKPTEEEEKSTEGAKETQEEIDYKKKFVESSRENQVLHSKSKKIAEAFNQAGQTPEPTDEELKSEYRDWEDMTTTEQKFAKDILHNKRKFTVLDTANQEFKNIEVWNEKVDSFVGDPKTLTDNPELDGREYEFKLYASKATRRGVDFEDLVSSFLYTVDKEKASKPSKKGSMFETGGGGAIDKGNKSGMLSVDEGRILRQTDYKKYKEMLVAGKIKNE